MDNAILDGMARALFVTAYADHCEECKGCTLFKGHKTNGHPRPGGAENWEDYAPPTSRDARDTALILWGKLEQAHRMDLWALCAAAAKADGMDPYVDGFEYPGLYQELFGHYLAMGALGHGVSWFDDHEEFPLEIPHIAFSL